MFFRGPQAQLVVQRNALKNCAEFMVAVRRFSEDIEAQVDFGKRGNANFAHAVYWGFASCGEDFCATRCFTWESFFSISAILSFSMSAGSERCHSVRDFSHSIAARSVRPDLAYTSARWERIVASWLSRATALRSVASASASLFSRK